MTNNYHIGTQCFNSLQTGQFLRYLLLGLILESLLLELVQQTHGTSCKVI